MNTRLLFHCASVAKHFPISWFFFSSSFSLMFQYWTGKQTFTNAPSFVTQEVCDQDWTYYNDMPFALMPCGLEIFNNVI